MQSQFFSRIGTFTESFIIEFNGEIKKLFDELIRVNTSDFEHILL